MNDGGFWFMRALTHFKTLKRKWGHCQINRFSGSSNLAYIVIVITKKSTGRIEVLLLLLAGIISLTDRLILITGFHFRITDIDQLVQWCGAKDYSQGVFHEPFFYGQDYNPMVEAFLAIPLVWSGVAIFKALPITVMVLSLLPFLLFSLPFIKEKSWFSAFIILLWPALMPIEYGVVANLPRGYISGLAIAGFTAFCLSRPKSTSSLALFGFVFPFAVWACPNSLILFSFLVPILWIENIKNWRFYVFPVLFGLGFFAVNIMAKGYYENHPESVVFESFNSFRPVWILSAWKEGELWTSLHGILPLTSDGGFLVLPVLLIISIALIRLDPKKGFGLIVCTLTIIVAFGHSRVYAGNQDLFYSTSRFWLAVPLVLSLALAWLFSNAKLNRWPALILLVLAVANVSVKQSGTHNLFLAEQESIIGREVPRMSIDRIEDHCDLIDSVATANHADLVIYLAGPDAFGHAPQFFNYGCRFLNSESPLSFMEKNDRLTWQLQDLGNRTDMTILLHGNLNWSNVPEDVVPEMVQSIVPMAVVRNYPGSVFELLNALNSEYETKRRRILTNKSSVD